MNLPEISLVLTDATTLGEHAIAALGGIHRAQQALAAVPEARHAVLTLFRLPEDTAIAPLRYLGDGGAPGAGAWVCADPVHLVVRGDGLAIVPLRLALAPDEREGFCAALNAVFAADEGRAACMADRGYVAIGPRERADFTPLAQAQGRDLKPLLPAGPAGSRWRRLMTEAQMLLHDAPFNEARAARGAPTVNGVWFWGAGTLPEVTAPAFTQVWTKEPLTLGLARHAGIVHTPPPDDAERWLGGLRPGRHLWVVEGTAGRTTAEADTAAAVATDIALASLIRALARETIARLEIVVGDRLMQLTPHDVRPWWSRTWWRWRGS